MGTKRSITKFTPEGCSTARRVARIRRSSQIARRCRITLMQRPRKIYNHEAEPDFLLPPAVLHSGSDLEPVDRRCGLTVPRQRLWTVTEQV